MMIIKKDTVATKEEYVASIFLTKWEYRMLKLYFVFIGLDVFFWLFRLVSVHMFGYQPKGY